MRLWILGSGTLLPDPLRGAPAHWVETGEHRILLDCGAGTLRTMARLGLPWGRITHLLISHFHTDHVGEVASLLFALKHGFSPPRQAPLEILGPAGTREHMENLAAAHGSFVLDPGFPVRVTELENGTVWAEPGGGFRVAARSTPHTETSLAFRLETPEGSLGYTGDTGPDDSLGGFFRGSQVLVAECSSPDGQGPETHLTPGSLLPMAVEAAPDLLVTVHAYPPLDPQAVPDLLRRMGYTREARAGRDGLRIDWTREHMEIEDPEDPAPPGAASHRPSFLRRPSGPPDPL